MDDEKSVLEPMTDTMSYVQPIRRKKPPRPSSRRPRRKLPRRPWKKATPKKAKKAKKAAKKSSKEVFGEKVREEIGQEGPPKRKEGLRSRSADFRVAFIQRKPPEPKPGGFLLVGSSRRLRLAGVCEAPWFTRLSFGPLGFRRLLLWASVSEGLRLAGLAIFAAMTASIFLCKTLRLREGAEDFLHPAVSLDNHVTALGLAEGLLELAKMIEFGAGRMFERFKPRRMHEI